MSTISAAEARRMVDDLDDILRAAILNGDVEAVFAKERKKMVSFLPYMSIHTK
jgi:hypothetical protein